MPQNTADGGGMTTLAPSEYRARCHDCGFETPEFTLRASPGIGICSGPSGNFNPFDEQYSYLRIQRRKLLCKSCGTLHERQDVTTDYPVWPILLIIISCILCPFTVSLVVGDIVITALIAMTACAFAVGSIWIFVFAFSKHIRAKYSAWIATIESSGNQCPCCTATDAIEPNRVSKPLPCPKCNRTALIVA
ncbi:MAG: hypothetical protein KY475_11225, partial [Planctomycetes bacterium]|nr:hypothetical protein [Planctomycetota bacterium]